MPYRSMKLDISPAQQKKALKGQKVKITSDMLDKGQLVFLHPVNFKKITNAKGNVMIEFSPGELMHTAMKHGVVKMPANAGELDGAGFLDSLWDNLKSVGSFLKTSGLGTALADAGQQLITPIIGEKGAQLARNVVKGVAGVGLKNKPRKKKPAMGSGLYL